MRLFIAVYFLVIGTLFCQENFLAKQYFKDGEFDKAVVYFEKLAKENPGRRDYAEGLVACYQQLEQYDKAEAFLLGKVAQPRAFPTFFIELGYNHDLQKDSISAKEYYQKALDKVAENPGFGYSIGHRFQKYALLDWAVKGYSTAMELNDQLNYNLQLARIFGEQGKVEQMYQAYLNYVYEGKAQQQSVLRNLEDFISTDPENTNNQLLRKTLLVNAQKRPDVIWNELLSWLFIHQNQYKNAFAQEKAIFKRTGSTSFDRISNLGRILVEKEALEIAHDVYGYVVDNSQRPQVKLNAQLQLLEIELKGANEKDLNRIGKDYETLLETYGQSDNTIKLQMDYANFLAFKINEPNKAISLLKEGLKTSNGRFSKGQLKTTLGDILVFQQRFNEALIYFSQVQKSLKNDVLGQNARYKVAQTSYFKGDFDWAFTQLKVLRGSTSQLIANDAMQLSLVISDNTFEDSTQTALKKYARADLLAYQNKNEEAIKALEAILEEHKGEQVEDETLFKLSGLLIEKSEFGRAELYLRKITEFFNDGILADDAHFNLGQLYENHLGQEDKAKQHYEQIIYSFQDSYYFPQARKNFRRLRGDIIN